MWFSTYLRSIHVVEVHRGVGLVQVSDVITMLIYKTEKPTCFNSGYIEIKIPWHCVNRRRGCRV